MKQTNNSPNCERAPDLMAFLYNEMNESEKLDFQLHLEECGTCVDELKAFGAVRESITAWRHEALAGFVSTPLAAKTSSKSAVAALRQFFDLSPLWLKGATALAVVTFCVLAGLAIVRNNDHKVPATNAVYTEQDVNRIVQEALAKQENTNQAVETAPETTVPVKTPKPKIARASRSSQFANSRRPLSRAEREQLAADLRLLSTSDDAALNLLGDRINQ